MPRLFRVMGLPKGVSPEPPVQDDQDIHLFEQTASSGPAPKGTSTMIYGFSAARNIAGINKQVFYLTLINLRDVEGVVTGGARGGDRIVGEWMFQNHPDIPHEVIVPGNRSQVEDWWTLYGRRPNLKIRSMPNRTEYRERNLEIVRRSQHLVAFPEYPELDSRSRRSGTWQTVRLARA